MLRLLSEFQNIDGLGLLRLFEYVTFRAVGAFITTFLICYFLGPITVNLLKKYRSAAPSRLDGLPIAEKLIEQSKLKEKTPSMGGILILGSVFIGSLFWTNLFHNPIPLIFLVVMISLGLLGFIDDYAKVKKGKGISGKAKLFFQFLIAGWAVFSLYMLSTIGAGESIQHLMIPFLKEPICIPWELPGKEFLFSLGISVKYGVCSVIIAYFLSVFTIVGASNGVNLSDGKDGLATGCTIICIFTFLIFSYLSSHYVFANYLNIPFVPGASEVVVFSAAIIGACVGFLWWNCNPAAMFMGDTGSLALGGCIGLIAVLVRQEIVLFIVGGVFVMESMSVMIQVLYFKLTKGKRLFLCTPIHHHFEQKGWTESQIVIRFWIMALIFAMIGLITLKLR